MLDGAGAEVRGCRAFLMDSERCELFEESGTNVFKGVFDVTEQGELGTSVNKIW